jgi:hypothetical protein
MLKEIEQNVIGILTEISRTRDDDNLLIAEYWRRQLGGSDITRHLPADALLEEFTNKRLTRPDTITRCRRKIQEYNPHLRGTQYEKRHNKTASYKKEIKEWY